MKHFLFFALSFLCGFSITAQSKTPNFTRFSIENTDCAYYMPAGVTPEIQKAKDKDGSEMYSITAIDEKILYVVVCKKLQKPISKKEEHKALLEQNLNSFKEGNNITAKATYFPEKDMAGYPHISGLGTFLSVKDSDGLTWDIEAWTDGNWLAIMALVSNGDYPYVYASEMFLRGFRFPNPKAPAYTPADYTLFGNFKPHIMGKSGCTVYLPEDISNPKVEVSESDEVTVYLLDETDKLQRTHRALCMMFKAPIKPENQLLTLKSMFEQFADGLEIAQWSDYTEDYYMLNGHTNLKGVSCVWKEKNGNVAELRGWVTDKTIIVLQITETKMAANLSLTPYDVYFNLFKKGDK